MLRNKFLSMLAAVPLLGSTFKKKQSEITYRLYVNGEPNTQGFRTLSQLCDEIKGLEWEGETYGEWPISIFIARQDYTLQETAVTLHDILENQPHG